ncbi:hypothetical protein [Stratiformator vulcanicus]|uniref:Uncharacterized protein n=1 Tax=Stratiformator vulcanicus TaxID=2527980 RepID=A0A517R1R4_9PLAN|nr:hypothetical protein [Stratiformator vulcanicus]QDT37816.1 hypothetical protein Pan189_21980 [Stratiformator vulcanicus]
MSPRTKSFEPFLLAVAGIVLTVMFCLGSTADARPNYLKAFAEQYPKVEPQLSTKKCFVCHDSNKKIRNHYGQAFEETLGAERVKNEEQLQKAFVGAEPKESSIEGKTFGDLIAEEKVPE